MCETTATPCARWQDIPDDKTRYGQSYKIQKADQVNYEVCCGAFYHTAFPICDVPVYRTMHIYQVWVEVYLTVAVESGSILISNLAV